MQKLKLDLDDLQVESFATVPDIERGGRGTVKGYSTSTESWTCSPYGANTCGMGCSYGNSCADSCVDCL